MTGQAATAPTLETARLRLRPYALADLADRAAMVGNPHVLRFFGGVRQGAEENWTRLMRYAGQWALLGYGLFAARACEGGRFVGEFGLARFGRGLGADFDEVPEAAWILDQWAEGQGLAEEAMRAAIGWHEAVLGPQRMVCIIVPDNLPSLRLAAKLGFRAYREAHYHERQVIVHERLPNAVDPG